MVKLFRKRSKKLGLPPGSLVHTGEPRPWQPEISAITYNADHIDEKTVTHVADIAVPGDSIVTWINVRGIHNVDIVRQIGQRFNLHSLVLEDILSTDQRPKLEDFDDYTVLVLKLPHWNDDDKCIFIEQMTLIIGKGYLISFQEHQPDAFHIIGQRLQAAKGRIRTLGADYLAYALVDLILDNYFSVFEMLAEHLETIEEELVANPTQHTLRRIHAVKRETILLRKFVWPLRELIRNLERDDASLFQRETLLYLRDASDHAVQILDTVETFREIVSSLLDTYLSSISNRTNEVMKVLTIIATIFIPLTFVAGIYGMNFKYMPELEWKWGYFAILGVMGALCVWMITWFKRKGWL